jgi:hypothetical protein
VPCGIACLAAASAYDRFSVLRGRGVRWAPGKCAASRVRSDACIPTRSSTTTCRAWTMTIAARTAHVPQGFRRSGGGPRGDALLTQAFEILATIRETSRYRLKDFCWSWPRRRSKKLIAGQVTDLEGEGKRSSARAAIYASVQTAR